MRARYGSTPSKDECVAILNETAYLHRDDQWLNGDGTLTPEDWGLSHKAAGTFGVRSDGEPCAVDILQRRRTGEAYDCLYAAGDGPATPQWISVGIITDPARPWVAPIDPGSVPPDPPDPPSDGCEAGFAAVLVQLQSIEASVDEMLRQQGVLLAAEQATCAAVNAGGWPVALQGKLGVNMTFKGALGPK